MFLTPLQSDNISYGWFYAKNRIMEIKMSPTKYDDARL